jgi:hypothetical protein
MIQRCPECGRWCEAGKEGFLDRGSRGLVNGFVRTIDAGEKIGGVVGKTGKKMGGYIAALGAGAIGFANAALESLSGDDFYFICPECGHEWSTDNPEDDQTEEYNAWLAEQERNSLVAELRDEYPSLIHATRQEKQDYVKRLQHELGGESNTDAQKATIYGTIAAVYQLLGERNSALQAVNASLALFEDDNTRVLKGIIMGQGRNAQDTYAAMQEVIHYKSQERAESPFLSTPQIEEEFSMLQSSFSQNFLSLPLQQRKHLVICDELIYLPQSFRVLPITEIPTDVKFPAGYPVSNTLYVCHPYRTDYYIPYESYEIEILRDEIEEFRRIMDHLGAKHIDYSDIFENGGQSSAQQKRHIHGGGNYAGQYSVHGSYESEGSSEKTRKLRNVLEGSEDFLLAGKPTLPPDTVWYSHRKEWQNKCESRLAGRLVHSEFTISTSSSEMTTESERKKIEADLKILLASVEGGTEGSKSYMLKKEKERTWKVNVEFYPLSDYDKNKEVAIAPLIDNVLPTSEITPPSKKINVVWIMAAIIAILISIILGLLLF